MNVVANPVLGVVLHAIGGLAAASFYLPFKRVRNWAWENFWIVGGVFSWLIAPWVFCLWLVPGAWGVLRDSPPRALIWTTTFGIIWGVGGLTFGLTMRYLGIALGYAIALGLCAACGTLLPPIFQGEFGELISHTSGWVLLGGVATCLVGIAFGGWAGISKERELSDEQKRQSVEEFRFGRGIIVAIICGVASAAMAFAIAAGKPIAQLSVDRGGRPLWQTLPIFIPVMLGGFLTNVVWCAALMARNKTLAAFTSPRTLSAVNNHADSVPLVANYVLCALAGLIWYFQFFFYGMGTTQMGKYGFSSWALHMASIILFSTLWGIALHEWRGTSRQTHVRITIGLALLVASMAIIGYGNHLAAQ
jgi:L-rhamnose-H+ transport protein